MPTLVDVAKHAGVSPMTVSRVMRNDGAVSDAMRERVERAVAEVGYVPNAVARSLRASRSDTIALVVTDMTNPFFTTLAHGVESAANDAGLALLLANSRESEAEERRLIRALLQRRVDGICFVPAGDGTATVRDALENETPVVVLDRRPKGRSADVVRADSLGGARRMGELLVALGHRVTAVLSGPVGVSTADDRVRGFRDAMTGEPGVRPPRVYRGAYSVQSGAAMARKAIAANPRPTALFAANNFIAIGVLHALEELGVRVPEDVAVVGFDDLPQEIVIFPFLTVIAQPAFEMGRRGVELLTDRMAGRATRPREVVLPTELVIRRSSGDPIRAAASTGPAIEGVRTA
jgi:LacI family transcriptional regulator